MQNRFFSEDTLQVLLHPERWKVVSSAFPPEVEPIEHAHHRQWMQRNTHDHSHQELMLMLHGRGVTLDMLARISGYSKFHFLRLFQRCTGQTVHTYIDHCRRQRVEAMLQQGCAKKEIAAALGFSCPAAFSRWLKVSSRYLKTIRNGL